MLKSSLNTVLSSGRSPGVTVTAPRSHGCEQGAFVQGVILVSGWDPALSGCALALGAADQGWGLSEDVELNHCVGNRSAEQADFR